MREELRHLERVQVDHPSYRLLQVQVFRVADDADDLVRLILRRPPIVLPLEGEELPAIGTYVSVFVEGLNIPAGELVWRRDKLAGIRVFEELSWTSIIPWIRQMIRNGGN